MDDNKLETISTMFDGTYVRRAYLVEQNKYYFSVVDIIAVLTEKDYQSARNYWKWLKQKLAEEGSEVSSKTNRLKMEAYDGKLRETDTLSLEDTFRLIESIPSPKAEPLKVWLSHLGNERIDEMQDPEKAMTRAIDYYKERGINEAGILRTINNIIDGKERTLENKSNTDLIKVNNNKLETISNIFENHVIRSVWNPDVEDYYFSVVDIVAAITNSAEPRKYWGWLKAKLKKEESEVSSNSVQLKMEASDGKYYMRDALSTSDVFRLIESIPSPKAEPFKLWLAGLGKERLDEMFEPTITIRNAIKYYRKLGHSDDWIKERLTSIFTRNSLVGTWKKSGITEGIEFAKLTNVIYQGIYGKSTRELKEIKGITKESLKDNMDSLELKLLDLGEEVTRQMVEEKKPWGYDENEEIAKTSSNLVGNTREDIEKLLGKSIITKTKDYKDNSSDDN